MKMFVAWAGTVVGLCLASLGWAGPSSDRDAIHRTLLQSRHLGAHGSGYNAESYTELAKKLSPAAVPTLLDLLVHDKEVRVGAVVGLASQCGAAIEPILNAAERGEVPFISLSDLHDALAQMERAAICSSTDREQAAKAIMTLDRLMEEENARRRRAVRERNARQGELTKRGLLMLDHEGRKSVSINECLEVVWESVKATGIDPRKSESAQHLLNRQIVTCYDSQPLPDN
jgi:hypothetical protein